MPFTAAHPAIVLPLGRISERYISLTALVIGSLTPDFEYFLRMDIKSLYSHTPLGILYFDLPVGLLLFLLYQTYVKNLLIDHLPDYLRQRFWLLKNDNKQSAPSAMRWFVIILSLALGALSHLFWDAFTHVTGWFVLHIDFLASKSIIGVHYFKLMQHFSTVIGLSVIAYSIILLPKTTVANNPGILKFWRDCALLFLGIALLRVISLFVFPHYHIGMGLIIVSAISSGLLALLIKCIFVHYTLNKTQN
ncbi:DUF4184 family protein [Mucilaginibacter sp. JRF]|uniref:DUF4184 family protein n=1 Tax=Mucilaginibacter sp. JRF TaxID=2780088 RepID=UPI00187F2BDF|nr:DUF4184 family protein [Mucilaginibacter sp. JRF]MBE9584826.1 DUF4184 family protein [Mucilaginibacter sp. JRF]